VYTPQLGMPLSARVVLDVITTATKLTNAHAKSEEAIVVLINLVFIS
jgi:hypothetical protein